MSVPEADIVMTIRPPDSCNHDLLARIPIDAGTVLDVGCGTGALGAAHKMRNSHARLLGIERNPEAAVVARTRLDEVAAVDVEQVPWPFARVWELDCLVYGDVLQHLRDPIAVLREHLKLLRPGGTVLICVPNIEHWSVLARLFRGEWDYESSGLLDVGHLRWFSRASILRAVRGVGLSVREVHERVFPMDGATGFLEQLTAALGALAIDSTEYRSRAMPLQYVLHCCPEERSSLTQQVADSPSVSVGDRDLQRGALAALANPSSHSDRAMVVASVSEPSLTKCSQEASRSGGEAPSTAAVDPGAVKVSVRGEWTQGLSQACLVAVSTAMRPADDASLPFLATRGLSGRAFRVLLNTLLQRLDHAKYLELGVGVGSTMASALDGNNVTAVGVDDFSDKSYSKEKLLQNISITDQSRASFTLVECSFSKLNTSELKEFDVLFYDGPVHSSVILDVLSSVIPIMRDTAVYIVDDWNSPAAQEGYRLLMSSGLVREIGAIEIRTTLDGSHPAIYGEKSLWHNGCIISVLARTHAHITAVSAGPQAISECASATMLIEEGRPWDPIGAISLGRDFPNAQFFRERPSTGTLKSYMLDDVTCSFATMLVYFRGRPIRETAYLVSDEELLAPVPSSGAVEVCESLGAVVQPLSRAWQNYYHWTVQTLPAILAAAQNGMSRLVALPRLTSRQEETIHLLGLAAYPRFPVVIGKAYHFRHLEVSDFIAGRGSFEISTTVQRVFQEMRSRVKHQTIAGPKLYLTRRNSGHRKIHNEDELSSLLARRGFEVVDPGLHNVSEQINLFRGADVIVAPHGAGLTNIGFCDRGTIIYELMPAEYANACFNRLAQVTGLNYHADAFLSDDSAMLHMRSFAIDLKVVNERLDTFNM